MAGFGQVIVGPPGSGKTTYCYGLKSFCDAIGRPAAIINLDPANDKLPYECAVDIAELITIEAVMEEFELGPNGGLIYCMEFLVQNRDWLRTRLESLKGKYLIFDLPGQVELYTHHQGMHELVQSIQEWGYRICAVNLVDSFHCVDPAKFISVLLLSLSTMRHLELPHLNVLSKIDLIEQFGETDFNLEFYTDVLDMEYLLERLDQDPWASRFRKLNRELCGLVESHALVSFSTLNVSDKHSMASLLKRADKASGYVFDQLYGVMRPQQGSGGGGDHAGHSHGGGPPDRAAAAAAAAGVGFRGGAAAAQANPAAAIRRDREGGGGGNQPQTPFGEGAGAIDPVEELGTFRSLAVQERYMGGGGGGQQQRQHHHHQLHGMAAEELHDAFQRDVVDAMASDDDDDDDVDVDGDVEQDGAVGGGHEPQQPLSATTAGLLGQCGRPKRLPPAAASSSPAAAEVAEPPPSSPSEPAAMTPVSKPPPAVAAARAAPRPQQPQQQQQQQTPAATTGGTLPVIDCSACGFPIVRGRKLRCGRCQQAYYCDAGCQKRHWPQHKLSCVKVQ